MKRDYKFKYRDQDYTDLVNEIIGAVPKERSNPQEVEFTQYVLMQLADVAHSRFDSNTDKMDAAEELYCYLASLEDFDEMKVVKFLFFALGYCRAKNASVLAYNIEHYLEIFFKFYE